MHTFADPLNRARQQFPDRVGVVADNVRLTYAETWSRCRRLAGALSQLGVEPGDRVAILAANSHRYLEAYLAIPASARVLVPLNTRHSEPELRYALEDSGARVLIADRDPGALAGAVERVIRIPDEYEALLAAAPEADLGVGLRGRRTVGTLLRGPGIFRAAMIPVVMVARGGPVVRAAMGARLARRGRTEPSTMPWSQA